MNDHDLQPHRFNSIEDGEAFLKGNHSKAITKYIITDREIKLNPEWLNAPYAISLLFHPKEIVFETK